ncbi:MAG: hypothetical protein ACYC2H_03795 [Thermoplasmatota archaeon]
MRGFTLLTASLLALALLAGCSQAPQGDAPVGEPTGDDPGRTARGGSGGGDDDSEEEIELEAVELLRTPLTMAGQGPESFDLTVPDGIVAVDFAFTGSPTFDQSGLRIELTGCGSYDSGLGFWGSTGGGGYQDRLCEEAAPGPATVTISATLLVFDGTFVLTGFTPAANATAPASNSTAVAR